jgi:hypothetical protein
MSTDNQPGVYRKGDSTRVARSASTAVALTFEGYERTGDLPETVSETEAPTTAQPEAVDPGTPLALNQSNERRRARAADVLTNNPEA